MHVCVYCSASNRVDPVFFDLARDLGTRLGRGGHTLVYGGGRTGLMGEVALATHAAGGRVIGVIPESMMDQEVAYQAADELIVTRTMRERKQRMEERADAFLTLPGGFGTLEELSEILVGRILKFHDKPVVLLNPDGFYDPLLALFEHFIAHRFAKPSHLDGLEVVTTAEQAMLFLQGLLAR